MDSTRIALNSMMKVIESTEISADTKRSIFTTAAKIVPHRSLGTDSNALDTVKMIKNLLGDEYENLTVLATLWMSILPDEVFDGKALYNDTASVSLLYVDVNEPPPPPATRLATDLEKWNVVLFLHYFRLAILLGGSRATKSVS